MTNNQVPVLEVTPDQQTQIEALARRRGYPTAAGYLLALIEADALAEAIGDDLADADDDLDLIAELRQAWHDAMTGNTRPISDLWDELDDE